MSITSQRITQINFAGDGVQSNLPLAAANNVASPGVIDIVSLLLGDNTITPPSGGTTPVAVTIIPPANNTNTITLKGDAADVGVVLHKTDPSTIALNSPTTTFVLTASAAITGVRLIWS